MIEPVVDLRDEPKTAEEWKQSRDFSAKDVSQISQVLFGEIIELWKEREDGWCRVKAVEQPEFTFSGMWEGYPGWIPRRSFVPQPVDYRPNAVVIKKYASLFDVPSSTISAIDIPFGAHVNVRSTEKLWARVQWPGRADGWMKLDTLRLFQDFPKTENECRLSILRTAGMLMTESYYKGAMSAYRPQAKHLTGFDGAGIVYLAFRVNGIGVPREAHEQFMKAKTLKPEEVKPGDLIFLAPAAEPRRIVHAMIYLGSDQAIESAPDSFLVRAVSLQERLGSSLADIVPMKPTRDHVIYLGTLLDFPEAP